MPKSSAFGIEIAYLTSVKPVFLSLPIKTQELRLLPLYRVLVLTAALLPLTSTPQTNELPAGVVAVVNGVPIQNDVLQIAVADAVARGQTNTAALRNAYLDGLIRTQLLAQRAKQLGLVQKVAPSMVLAKARVLADTLRQSVHAQNPITQEAIKAAVQSTEVSGDRQQMAVSHILLASKAQASALLTQLKNGASFKRLAISHSLDWQTRSNGGDTGWQYPALLPTSIGAAVADMQRGAIFGEPVQTDRGWHVLHVTGVRPVDGKADTATIQRRLADKQWAQYVRAITAGTSQIPLTTQSAVDPELIKGAIAELKESGISETPELRDILITEMALLQSLANAATASTTTPQQELEARINVSQASVLASALQALWIGLNKPTDEEIQQVFEKQSASLRKASQQLEYMISEIVVPSKDDAQAVIARLNAGEEFSSIASAHNAGDSPHWQLPTNMAPEIGGAVVALNKGDVGATPIQTTRGWHLIKVENTRQRNPEALEPSRDNVYQTVLATKWQAYLEKLRQKATIVR